MTASTYVRTHIYTQARMYQHVILAKRLNIILWISQIATLDVTILLGVFLFLLIVILSEPREMQNRKNLDTHKKVRVKVSE